MEAIYMPIYIQPTSIYVLDVTFKLRDKPVTATTMVNPTRNAIHILLLQQ